MSDSNAQMKGVGIDLSPMDNILWKGKFIDRAGSVKLLKGKKGLYLSLHKDRDSIVGPL